MVTKIGQYVFLIPNKNKTKQNIRKPNMYVFEIYT